MNEGKEWFLRFLHKICSLYLALSSFLYHFPLTVSLSVCSIALNVWLFCEYKEAQKYSTNNNNNNKLNSILVKGMK